MQPEEMYRRYGIKTETKLRSPVFLPIGDIKLPHNTVLIYLPTDDLTVGPTNSWSIVENTERDLVVKHDTETPYKEGARTRPFQISTEEKAYHNRYRRFTRLRSIDTALRNKNTIMVENTAMLRKGFKYTESWYRQWREETNFQFNAFHNIVKTMDTVEDRVFILPIEAPNRAFGKDEYARISEKRSQEWISLFDTPEALLQGYLYTFLTYAKQWVSEDEKDHEALNDALYQSTPWSLIPRRHAEKLWLMFQVGDVYALITLEKLVTIVAEKGINVFLNFSNAVIEQRNDLSVGGGVNEKEIVFAPDGTVLNEDSDEEATNSATSITVDENDANQKTLLNRITRESKRGRISNREQAYLLKEMTKTKDIKAPDGKSTLGEYANITVEDLKLKKPESRDPHPLEFDDSYQNPTNVELAKQYNTELLDRDIARTILSFQKAGTIVKDVRKELRKDAAGAVDYYEVDLKPINGKATPFRFDIPKVGETGRFRLNGTDVFYVAQRSDVPIRKIKPSEVKLTSYYGQCFITRGRLKAVNYSTWLFSELTKLDETDAIKSVHRDVADLDLELPHYYTLLGTKYLSLAYKDVKLFFNYHERKTHFGDDVVKKYEKRERVLVGQKGKLYITLGKDNLFYLHTDKGEEVLGQIESLLDIPTDKRVLDAAEVRIFSKNIPLGMVLGQRIGLTAILNKLGVNYRTFTTGDRKTEVGSDEYTVKFSDKTLVLPVADRYAMQILNSFNIVKKPLANLNISDMDNPDAYFSLLEEMGLGLRYYIEIDTMFDLFVDPMTEDLLVEMEEPTNLTDLFFRSAELLTTHHSPKEIDPAFMRDRGYERFSGFVYKAYVDGVRVQRSRPQSAKAPISIDPKRVIMDISTDSSKNMVEVSNPMRNIREKSLITFAGEGGRTAQTMTPELRSFHPNELGHTSVDNTADSGKVGINATRSHKTLIKNLRGISYRYNHIEDGPESLFTTTAMNFPGVDRDELKRLNFLSTQYDSVYPLKNYRAMPLHTPMEYQIPYMVDEEFAVMAPENGKVLTLDEDGMTVLYDNGEEKGYTLGRVYGHVAGITVPHTVYTDLKVGSKFKKHEPVCWNTAYFKRDYLRPDRLAQKQALIIPTILQEIPLTFEDSSAMYEGLGDEFKVDLAAERDIHVPFTTELAGVVNVGDEVDENDSLFVMVPEHLQAADGVDNALTESLKELNKDAPKAKSAGVVERIDVFYYGQRDEMHPTLRKLANASDKRRKKRVKQLKQTLESENGMVTSSVNFGGNKIQPNTAVIKYYITKRDLPTVSGNKTVNGAQLKNTVSQQLADPIPSVDSDEEALAYFSYNGNNNRVVLSPMEQGLGNRALMLATKKGCEIYRGKNK